MQILVDADACPKVIRDVLFKAVQRVDVPLVLVANQYIQPHPSPLITAIQVPSGLDVADERIVELAEDGDLVISSDIPLADLIIEKGAHVITPRGQRFTRDTIKGRLAKRDFMSEMRSSGVDTGGPPPFNAKDKETFANQLDRFLTKALRRKSPSVKK